MSSSKETFSAYASVAKHVFDPKAREFVPGDPYRPHALSIKTPPEGNDINPEKQFRTRLKAYLKAEAEALANKNWPVLLLNYYSSGDLDEIYDTIKMLSLEKVKQIEIGTLMRLLKKSGDENDIETGSIVSKAIQDILREGRLL